MCKDKSLISSCLASFLGLKSSDSCPCVIRTWRKQADKPMTVITKTFRLLSQHRYRGTNGGQHLVASASRGCERHIDYDTDKYFTPQGLSGSVDRWGENLIGKTCFLYYRTRHFEFDLKSYKKEKWLVSRYTYIHGEWEKRARWRCKEEKKTLFDYLILGGKRAVKEKKNLLDAR